MGPIAGIYLSGKLCIHAEFSPITITASDLCGEFVFFHPNHLRFYSVGGIVSHSCNALAYAMFLRLQNIVCKFDYFNQEFEYLSFNAIKKV